MSGTRLGQVLAYAARGWPVFPCQAGQKIPATGHGHLDATTDPEQITTWFSRNPTWNLAIATGTPGPDVLAQDEQLRIRRQLAGRRRPPGRPGRAGDHQNPRFRPQQRPDPHPRTRPPGRSR